MNKTLSSSFLRNRNHFVILITIVLFAITAWLTWRQGPGTRLGGEIYCAYQKSGLTKSLFPLLTMDASMSSGFSMPYCGWQPFYSVLFYPFALLHIDFYLAATFVNSAIFITTAFMTLALVRISLPGRSAELAFIVALLGPATVANISHIFVHILFPLTTVVTAYFFFYSKKQWRQTGAFLAWPPLAAGLLCGISSWLSYLNLSISGLFLLFTGWQWLVRHDKTARPACLTLLKFNLLMGLPLFLCLTGMIWLKHTAFTDPLALPFRAGITGSKVLEKIIPYQGYFRSTVLTLIRIVGTLGFCFLVLLSLRLTGRARFKLPARDELRIWMALSLPTFLSISIFSGEMAFPNHYFHTLLWILPSMGLILFLDEIEQNSVSFNRWLLIPGTLALLLPLAYLAIPFGLIKRIAPADIVQSYFALPSNPTPESMRQLPPSLSTVLPVVLKQTLPLPGSSGMVSQGFFQREIAPGEILEKTADDSVILYFSNQMPWEISPALGRTAIRVPFEEVIAQVQMLLKFVSKDKIILIIHRIDESSLTDLRNNPQLLGITILVVE